MFINLINISNTQILLCNFIKHFVYFRNNFKVCKSFEECQFNLRIFAVHIQLICSAKFLSDNVIMIHLLQQGQKQREDSMH